MGIVTGTVSVVGLVTVGEPTVMSAAPEIETVVTPWANEVLLPVTLTSVVVPRFPLAGAIEMDTGRTLNVAVGASRAPVATVTVRPPTAAFAGTRIGTDKDVGVVTATGPSRTISFGVNETVVVPLKFVPLPVMFNVTS